MNLGAPAPHPSPPLRAGERGRPLGSWPLSTATGPRQLSSFRRAFLFTFGTVACAVRLLAVEEPAAVEWVGDLGREECLVIEGGQAFSGAGIVKVLRAQLEFHARSEPAAPLTDYLAWLGRTVQQGYQHS